MNKATRRQIARSLRAAANVLSANLRVEPGSSALVAHVTGADAARSIMSGGFKPVDTPKGQGVSVSVNTRAARALLTTAQRMFSFRTMDDVAEWFIARGAPEDRVRRTADGYEEMMSRQAWRLQGGRAPASLYLSLMADHHPSTGGDANIPWNEFLWADIGKTLLRYGKKPVAVIAEYSGVKAIHPGLLTPSDMIIEAELFVPAGELRKGFLEPKEVVTKPRGIDLDEDTWWG